MADPEGAMILIKDVDDPERFGVARLEDDRVVEIIEKPTNPPTSYAVTGCYFYDSSVFDIINALEPSKRGELEITDVNSAYIERGSLRHHLVDGWWADAGTVTSLYRAGTLVAAEHGNAVLRQMRSEGEASDA